MNKEIKEKVLERLRSGNVAQGQGCLRNGQNQFCCLGVVCDVVAPDQWAWNSFHRRYQMCHRSGAAERNYLPDTIAEIAGIDEEREMKLVEMNDSGKTFLEIADYIEKEL